jgi:hypothetical protein
MTTAYGDIWPETPLLLWRTRHYPVLVREPSYYQYACPTCSHVYSKGYYRAHLRSEAHARNRGWWAA